MATTIVYVKNGFIFKVGNLTPSQGGVHLREGWALTEDYFKGSRGWEVMILPPINGRPAKVECVKHSPNTGRERYRRTFPLKDGAYHLISTINGAWAYFRRLDLQQWLDRRDITSVQHASPNGEFETARILDTGTSLRRVEIATDGKMEEISFSSGRTDEWRRTCPGTSCHEWFTTYRITGASWTLITKVYGVVGPRVATLYTNSRDVMSLEIPDTESVRETAKAVEELLDPVQGCLDLAMADAAIAKKFPSAAIGLRPGKETKGVKFNWFKVFADLERGEVHVHHCVHMHDMRHAQLDGNFGRKPIWTIRP